MIIDGHSHGLHGGYLDGIIEAGGEWTKKRIDGIRQRARSLPALLDVAFRVEQLERNGIDRQVVTPQTIPVDPNLFPGDAAARLSIARETNDNMARIMEDSKGKLICAGTVPMASFEHGGRQEMERAIKSLGLKAMNLPTNLNGNPLDLPEYEPFWAQAEAMDVTVYLHPWAQPGRSYEAAWDIPHTFGWPYETTVALSRLVFSGIMERYPKLKIVGHHLAGGMIPFFMGRIVESHDPTAVSDKPHLDLPLPLSDYFSRFYYDSAVGGSAAATKCAYEVVGADHIVFATDAPNGPGAGEARLKSYVDLIKSLGLPPEDTEKILSGNIRRILNLD